MNPVLYLHGFTGGLWEAEVLEKTWGLPVRGIAMPGHAGPHVGERFDFEEAVERVLRAAKEVAEEAGGAALSGQNILL